jgi:hypothetical protein
MKSLPFASAFLALLGLASTGSGDDHADWVAKGYRWSVVDGPYAYITKEDAKNDRSRSGSKSVSDVIGHAYYLRPGKIVVVVETDASAGLSKIRIGGVASDLWTATKNLTTRPFRDTLGVIETPEMAGVLSISSATPSPGSNAGPAQSVSPSPTGTPLRQRP